MKFIADRMLGKLAKELRMLGYDPIYFRGEDFHQLVHLARQEDRIILTRNTKLALRRPKDRILTLTENKYISLLYINLLLLFVGTFMDITASVLILTPILLPIAQQLGIDPIHFGLVMVMNLVIGPTGR